MHIKIECESRRGLRIIDEIPDIPLCKIEGYNGIGKTSAIKLLRLCTGEQPFTGDDAAWRTFRNQLAQARVEVTGLRDGESIVWQLDPSHWPDKPEPLGERLGQLWINDTREKDYQRISSILKVYHILAAETPLGVLTDRIEVSAKQITEWAGSVGEQRRADIDFALERIQKRVMACEPYRVRQDVGAAKEAATLVRALTADLGAARKQTELLDKAVEVSDRLDQVRGRGPEMDEKLRELQARLDEIEQKKKHLDDQVTQASSSQHRNQQAEREFENAQKHLIRQDNALRQVRGALEKQSATAGVEPDRKLIATERTALGARLNDLLEKLPQVHATPMLIAVLNDMVQCLEDAKRHDLGEAILIDADGEAQGWTIDGLRQACLRQIAVLAKRTPSADGQRLTVEIDDIRVRLDALAQASDAFDGLEQAEANFIKAEARLRKAAEDLPEQTARTLDELMKARNDLDKEGNVIQGTHARLTHARELLGGGMTEDALAAELVRLCREAKVEVTRVRGRRDRMRSELDEMTLRQARAVQSAERVQQAAEERARAVTQVIQYLQSDQSLSWIRRALPSLVTLQGSDVVDQAAALETLVDRLDRARSALTESYAAVQGIGSALNKLQSQLRYPGDQNSKTVIWDTAARLWLAEEVRQWFDNELIREALFNGARNVSLDWQDMTLSWTVDGESHQRPLSAFSSGQQAFAYTHARVAQLEREQGPPNRLIALDEFSSFLDSPRMESLVRYLTDRQRRMVNDHVVVILPLEATPRHTANGDPIVAARIRALEQRGYFAEAFTL